MIQGLWEQHNDTIIYLKPGVADTDTYRFEPMEAILDCWEKTKRKDKHSKHFHEQQKQFSLFVIYIDGMIGNEALVALANSSQLMAEKMDEPTFQVRVWINGWITIAVVR